MSSELFSNKTLHDYCQVPREGKTPDSMLALIKRYSLPWSVGGILFDDSVEIQVRQSGTDLENVENPVLCYRGVLTPDSSTDFVSRIKHMATRPEFYRLNCIRQLSTTSMAINLDGNHNRLSHSLGTLDIASRLVAKLEMKPVEKKAVLVYAFVHDCFHGPMGHTMDLIKDVIWGRRVEERIDKHLLLRNIEFGIKSQTGLLWHAVFEEVADDESECRAIFEYLLTFLDSDIDIERRNFLVEIVDSDLDADRLDYVWRDRIHLLEGSADLQSVTDSLVNSARAIEDKTGVKHLHYDRQLLSHVEKFLEARVELYRNYYEHPLKLVADEMLVHAIFYVLQREGMLNDDEELIHTQKDFGDIFAFLTDDGLFHWLTEVTAKEIHRISFALFQDFRANRLFRIVTKKSLRRQHFGALTRRIHALNAELKRLVTEKHEEIRDFTLGPLGWSESRRRKYLDIIEGFNRIIKRSVKVTDDDPEPEWRGAEIPFLGDEEDIYRIQVLYGNSFRKKLHLERLLWRELLKQEGMDTVLLGIARTLSAGRTGDSKFVSQIKDRLEETPLIFVSLSWIPGTSQKELENHKRGISGSGIRFYDSSGPCEVNPELKVISRDEDYHAIVSAPAALLSVKDMKRRITETFENIVEKRLWIFPDLLPEIA